MVARRVKWRGSNEAILCMRVSEKVGSVREMFFFTLFEKRPHILGRRWRDRPAAFSVLASEFSSQLFKSRTSRYSRRCISEGRLVLDHQTSGHHQSNGPPGH